VSLLVMFSRFQDDQITNDSLTGLNNRYSLDNYLSDKFKIYFEGIRGKEKLYLIMMDINLFKQINDKYGHTEGDRALKLVASTFKEIGGKYDKLFLARFGGDEFVAVYETVNEHRVNELCVDIKESVKKAAEGLEYPLEIGVGYALYRGKSMTLTELYNVADIALYQDKDKMKKGDAN
jgi:diguanylate cyclase (GGDEF)-like protein